MIEVGLYDQKKKSVILSIVGTRPEAIKLAPAIQAIALNKDCESIICSTGQHREMLNVMLNHFGIVPNYELDIMTKNQDLISTAGQLLNGINKIICQTNPSMILVQGDTLTAMAGGLAGVFNKIPIGHIEAGLRTGNLLSPWPEEINRRVISSFATLHFSPTQKASDNLIKENISKDNIFITGNTVIDALEYTKNIINADGDYIYKMKNKYQFLGDEKGVHLNKSIVLVTGHRRESFGLGFENICTAIKQLASNANIEIIYPVHLNPNVQNIVYQKLSGLANVRLLDPLGYKDFIYFMSRARVILTDSGGIQEEAPSLGKPVLVMREVTERVEAIESGAVKLVGTNPNLIVKEVLRLINNDHLYRAMQIKVNPYGDGKAGSRISSLISKYLCS